MSKHGRTKLVPQSTSPPKKQSLQVIEESNPPEQKEEEPVSTELDMEIQCPRCNEIMELCSSFDKLVYSCESCSFLLKCV
jgi:phage FluMu protein Com